MARNQEKAQSMLNRFIMLKNEEKKKPRERRPFLASECRDLAEASKWWHQIRREIISKTAEIQNKGLGEHRLRDLNDEINKLIREKTHWERRILDLGGVDVPNPSGRGPGYRYYGAAKDLPGVRELYEKPQELRKRRTRYDIRKRIDASYYGYMDDEAGMLEKLEVEVEERLRRAAEAKREVKSGEVANPKGILVEEEEVVEEERDIKIKEEEEETEFVAHVPLLDTKEIEMLVLEKKKKDLLSKYASQELLQEENETKQMLNIKRVRIS